MEVTGEEWQAKLSELAKNRASDRQERIALENKLSNLLGAAVKEVDNLSLDPEHPLDTPTTDAAALKIELEKNLSQSGHAASVDDLITFKNVAVDGLCKRAYQIYDGKIVDESTGVDPIGNLRAVAHGKPVEITGSMQTAFTHFIVLDAARNLKHTLGVSNQTAQSLLKLALQSTQASLFTSFKPF